jgi:integrase
MNNTFNILFHLKKPKQKKSTLEHPIYMRVTCDGKRFEKSLHISIDPSKWSKEFGRATGKSNASQIVNNHLDAYKTRVVECYRELINSKQIPTSELIYQSLYGEKAVSRKVLEVFEEHNMQMLALVGIDFETSTYKRYQTTKNHIENFLAEFLKLPDFRIDQVNHKFISDLEFYLKTEKKINNNSTVKYLKNFHKVIRIAIANGEIEKDPYANHRFKLHEVEKSFLTSEELSIVETKELHVERLDQIRDVFLFCCYTGLAYIDVFKLSPEHIVTGEDGLEWIIINRTKTNVKSRIPLFPKAKAIIKKYSTYLPLKYKNKLLPVPSNQKMNAYLKEIADICNINKEFTSHMGRHTFATLTLSNQVPLETVSKMLGHSSVSMTEHYAKITDKKISEDTKHLRDAEPIYKVL